MRMMNTKILLGAAVVLVSGMLASCDLTSVNQSPNAINSDNIKSATGMYALLVGAQAGASDFYAGDRSRMGSFFTWQMCSPPGLGRPQPVTWNGYLMQPDGPINDCWLGGYRTNAVTDQIIKNCGAIDFGDPKINNTLIGMADFYKALMLGEMASFYGSIPIDIVGLDAPKFATQAEAFARVQTILDDALAKMAAGGAKLATQDFNFGGDATLWIPAIHSLKARYYLAVGDYQNALTQSNAGISAAAGTVNAIFTSTAGEYSPWGHWSNDESGQPIRVEQSYIALLKSEAGDTRLAAYFLKNDSGNYVGYRAHAGEGEAFVDSASVTPTKTSTLKKYSGYGDLFPIISFEENELIKAECEARVGSLPNAITGVNAIRTGAGLGATTATTQADVITEILKQKHLQLFLEGQTYTDMRRTKTLPSTKVPVRFLYPVSELNANPNVPADNDALVNAIVK